MKKFIWKVLIIILLITNVVLIARAEDTIPPLSLSVSVNVPASCEVTDIDGATHSYTAPSPDSYWAICALQTALQNGDIADAGLSNAFPEFGLFVTSINNTSADPSSQYWALFQNGGFASLGLTSLPIVAGDEIKLDLQDFSGTSLGSSLTLNINSLISIIPPAENNSHHHSSSGSTVAKTEGVVLGAETKVIFDLKKASDFLIAQQKENGSFGEDIYTDWTALALASGNYQEQTIKLIRYFRELKLENPHLTDYERHAMALMALGLNPYNIYPSSGVANGENYIKKIIGSFDGKQFGDLNEDNDDIFALIVLQNAGYAPDEEIIKNTISFILSAQREDGSWDGSVDMTGAAIEAIANAADESSLFWGVSQADEPRGSAAPAGADSDPKRKQLSSAITKAKDFLKKTQKDTGGWNNASSTAWAIEGILALGEKPEDWIPARNAFSIADAGGKNDNTPLDYLATIQDTDGGIKNENMQNKIWETAYVVSALSGKTWNQIMQNYEKPKDVGNVLGISTEVKKEITPKKIITKAKIKSPTPVKVENTATAVNALQENTTPQSEPETQKENWFIRFLKFIF